MSLLAGRWQLEDIDDAEAFVRAIIRDSRLQLFWHEWDDLFAYLAAALWELHERWDRSRAPSFHQYARYVLKLRVVDYVRLEQGRTRWTFSTHVHERERPAVLSLDDRSDNGRLADTVAARASDPQDDRDPDLARVLGGGDRQRTRDLEELGLAPPRRAA